LAWDVLVLFSALASYDCTARPGREAIRALEAHMDGRFLYGGLEAHHPDLLDEIFTRGFMARCAHSTGFRSKNVEVRHGALGGERRSRCGCRTGPRRLDVPKPDPGQDAKDKQQGNDR
jgi:hypothetical protein